MAFALQAQKAGCANIFLELTEGLTRETEPRSHANDMYCAVAAPSGLRLEAQTDSYFQVESVPFVVRYIRRR